jgi:hypothetical protein
MRARNVSPEVEQHHRVYCMAKIYSASNGAATDSILHVWGTLMCAANTIKAGPAWPQALLWRARAPGSRGGMGVFKRANGETQREKKRQ